MIELLQTKQKQLFQVFFRIIFLKNIETSPETSVAEACKFSEKILINI